MDFSRLNITELHGGLNAVHPYLYECHCILGWHGPFYPPTCQGQQFKQKGVKRKIKQTFSPSRFYISLQALAILLKKRTLKQCELTYSKKILFLVPKDTRIYQKTHSNRLLFCLVIGCEIAKFIVLDRFVFVCLD